MNDKKKIEAIYGLSPLQEGMLFHTSADPAAGLYFEQTSYTLTGRLDVERFRRAWESAVERHAILRTAFNRGATAQVVFKRASAPWTCLDWRGLPDTEQASELQDYLTRDRQEGFDITTAPLLRFALMHLSDTSHKFVVSYHHALLDGWSYVRLLKEVTNTYEALGRNADVRLPEPRPFRDYIKWLKRQDQTKAEEFWRGRLRGITAPAYLSDAFSKATPGGELHELERIIDSEATGLTELTRRAQVTLNTIVQGAWALLLSRYTGKQQLIFGATVSGRPHDLHGVESMIGLFINTIPVPVHLRSVTVTDFLRHLQRQQADSYAYQYARLSDIHTWSEVSAGQPLFDTLVVFENYPTAGTSEAVEGGETNGGFTVSGEESWERVNYPVALVASGSSALRLRLAFDEGVIGRAAAEGMLRHLVHLLEAMAQQPAALVTQLPMLAADERQAILELGRGAESSGEAVRVEELIAQRAGLQPEAIAVSDGTVSYSYAELQARAEQIAARLRRAGIGAEDVVAVLLPRSADAVCAWLGVWCAGGAYLPLEATYPRERLAAMVADSGARCIVSRSEMEELLRGVAGSKGEREGEEGQEDSLSQCQRVWIDDLATETTGAQAADEPANTNEGGNISLSTESLAYVIYTSGSTGRPKGVGITHAGLCNLVRWHVGEYGISAADRMTQIASLSFDAAGWEVWPALSAGARVEIVPEGVRGGWGELGQWMREREITVSFLPTPVAEEMLNAGGQFPESLRVLLTGGDRLRRWAETGASYELVNHYGPTEMTVLVSCGAVAVEGVGLPQLGRAIPNTQLYVLDVEGNLCPLGVAGELYVCGAGLARGYIGRPELTAERFVPNPLGGVAGARLYRTGDRVCWSDDGQLEFLGRQDDQIKLRGYRIELGEIEAVLSSHACVSQCAVLLKGQGRNAALVAYVSGAAEPAELLEHATRQLPAYMIPQRIIRLDALPLTPNGKIDRKTLSVLAQAETNDDGFIAPRTQIEEILCGIWAEVLGCGRVGVDEDFFALGGHSLLATQAASRVRTVFGVELPLRVFFETPTVAALATEIERLMNVRGETKSAPPITHIERTEQLPLSFAQQRLWFVHRLNAASDFAYHIPLAVRLSGSLNISALTSALTEVVRRHESLRTSFPTVDGQPIQLIHHPQPVSLPLTDLSHLPLTEREQTARSLAAAEVARPFDLSLAPLLRASLLRLAEEEHILVVVLHHIISDGWSTGVLVKEFGQLYEAYTEGRPSPLSELPIQYADYAVWQRAWLQGEVLESQLSYWRAQLAGMERLELTPDAVPPASTAAAGAVVRFTATEELTLALQETARREGVTLFMLLVAAFQLLLSRHTGRTDIAIGTDIANRNRLETEALVGFFINQLVLRTEVDHCTSIGQLLSQVRETVLGAYAHQELPFERVVEEVGGERTSGTPLFTTKLVLQNAPEGEAKVGAVRLSPAEGVAAAAKLDLHLAVEERIAHATTSVSANRANSLETTTGATTGAGLDFVLTYPPARFTATRIERMAAHYLRALEFLAHSTTATSLDELQLTDEQERQQVARLGCGEALHVSGTVVEWIERQAALTPERIALVGDENETVDGSPLLHRYTYAELSQRSNQLARHLRTLGVSAETRVALCLGRTPQFIIAALAVWKAGGAYVPLDPEHPAARLAQMMEDAGTAVVITNERARRSLPAHWGVEVSLDGAEAEAILQESDAPLEFMPAVDALAYVLYTSGSTGQPKGVMVEHRQLANYVQGVSRRLDLQAGAHYALVSTVAADLGLTVLYPALVRGGTLHVINTEQAVDGVYLRDYFKRHEIDCVKVTPSQWRAWSAAAGEVVMPRRKLVLGGEATRSEWVREATATAPQCEVWNHYGPTETTVGVSAGRADATSEMVAGTSVALGGALANARLYVLDRSGQLCPVSVPGELYIGGMGVTRGYVNRPELTAERFIPDPFSGEAGQRLYRTGDVVKWREDGKLEFIGRVDAQVKLRGYRVELAEIEAVLSSHAGVEQCAVIVTDVAGTPTLVAYISGEVEASELREYAIKLLPAYMIPQRIMRLDALPLTANGKIDRKALPAPDAAEENTQHYHAPRTPTEEIICNVWAEVLGRERVGIDEDFFALGGHSLLATQVVSRMRAVFGVEVALRVLFETPTAEALAAEVERLRESNHMSVVPSAPPLIRAARNGQLPLSFAQQRLWFIDQLEPGNPAYNSPRVVRFDGELNYRALVDALSEIVRRHEVLRTSFPTVDGQPVQVVSDARRLHVPVVDIEDLVHVEGFDAGLSVRATAGDFSATAGDFSVREQLARRIVEGEAARPFDLAVGPVVRALLVRLDARQHVLVVVLHHIVSDGWSAGVLVREFGLLYEAFRQGEASPLSELPVQYGDYAVWQREWLQGEVLETQLAYWREQLAGVEPLQLPVDRGGVSSQRERTNRGAVVAVELSRELTEELREVSRREGVTVFMLLVAAYQLMLGRYSGQRDVAVGTAIANRNRLETEGLVGFFVNQLVLRARLGECETGRELLGQVRETVLGAYAHQDLPFERVVEEVAPERELTRSPLFQHAIELQSLQRESVEPWQLGEMKLSSVTLEGATTKLDLDVVLYEREAISGYAYYDESLFSEATIEFLLRGFESILNGFVRDLDVELRHISQALAGGDSYAAQLSLSLELLEV